MRFGFDEKMLFWRCPKQFTFVTMLGEKTLYWQASVPSNKQWLAHLFGVTLRVLPLPGTFICVERVSMASPKHVMVIDIHETWQNPVNLDMSVVQGLAEFRLDFLWVKGWWTIADHKSLLHINAWLYHSEDCKVPFTCGCLLTALGRFLQLTFPLYFRCSASCIPRNLVKSLPDSVLVVGGSIFKCGG